MQQMIKRFLLIGSLIVGLPSAWGFALLGPVNNGGDDWQATLIGYNPLSLGSAPPYLVDGLLTGPKNLGEEYRRNTPVMYYACNTSFLDYFGTNGLAAINAAFSVFNGLTNVDNYSSDLSEFPLNSMSENYLAFEFEMLDLKSVTMSLLMEQLGLADAVRYIWALHNRYLPPGATCTTPGPGNGVVYMVVQRNFDITASPLNQLQYSAYVNGALYTYSIDENCGVSGASPPDVDAIEVPTDPLSDYNPPVASGNGVDFLYYGNYYTSLTRDDVAGLRYLYSTNNYNTESPTPGVLLEASNNPTILVTTSDLGALVTSAQTNSPAVIAGLFPGVVASATSYFTNLLTPVVVTYATNYYGEPFGTPPHIITITNGYTNAIIQWYVTSFANVVTNSYQPSSTAILQTTTFGSPVGAPFGSPFVTTTSSKKIVQTNTPTGDYFLIPAGSCGLTVVKVWQTNVVSTTNLLTVAINPDGSFITQSLINYYTNHIIEVRPCNFVAPTPQLYQGIGQLQFKQANYDSLLGQLFQPITNVYTMVMVSNSQPYRQTFQRVVTQPDFQFAAADLAAGPAALWIVTEYSRNINFDQGNILPGLAGPGVINPSTLITYDKVGPTYMNVAPTYQNGPYNPNNGPFSDFIWGSFDGSTNVPVIYPNGTSITNLAAAVLVQISPSSLPNGAVNAAYNQSLQVTGGSFNPPFSWSLVELSPGLPPGLTLSPSGTISGTPTQSGKFDFVVQLTDSVSRYLQRIYSITIN
ncbi:MAG TPA: Ig domain-containing protein [Candidatus Acidoferrum sp.]|nr:Ig domain-containing protein [Candidatus Acidoferrum sp.]